jgi:hypothetical protein
MTDGYHLFLSAKTRNVNGGMKTGEDEPQFGGLLCAAADAQSAWPQAVYWPGAPHLDSEMWDSANPGSRIHNESSEVPRASPTPGRAEGPAVALALAPGLVSGLGFSQAEPRALFRKQSTRRSRDESSHPQSLVSRAFAQGKHHCKPTWRSNLRLAGQPVIRQPTFQNGSNQ